MITSLRLATADGLSLDAELNEPDGPARAGMVLCAPHPLSGGSMCATVVDDLFGALPAHGIACLRFDFRGVGSSEGVHDDGDAERHDVLAAVDALGERLTSPLVLAGWSFGGDLALSVAPERIAGWFAVTPPLRYARDLHVAGGDPRPKMLALAGRDEVRPAYEVLGQVRGWAATDVEVLPHASHFFGSGTGRLVELAAALAERVSR